VASHFVAPEGANLSERAIVEIAFRS